jgi:hypothetical protein
MSALKSDSCGTHSRSIRDVPLKAPTNFGGGFDA